MGNETATTPQKVEATSKPGHGPVLPPPRGAPALHRVCIQCNAMFRVSPENFDAKQCPNCHKG